MADSVENTIIAQTKTHIVTSHVFTIDGTEGTVILVDKSGLTGPDGTEPGKLVLERIDYAITGMSMLLAFDHTTDDKIGHLGAGQGTIDFTGGGRFQGFVDPASAGDTGDIIATTLTTDSGDVAYLVTYCRKKDGTNS